MLRSKDGNGKYLYRDSDVELPVAIFLRASYPSQDNFSFSTERLTRERAEYRRESTSCAA